MGMGLNGVRKARSGYEILQVAPDVTTKELAKTYRQMSRLIHPDKCKHEHAHEAFQLLLEAFNEMKDAKNKDRYAAIWEQVVAEVTKEREKINKEKEANDDT